MSKYFYSITIFVTILLSLRFFDVRFLGDFIGIKLPFLFVLLLVSISLRYFLSCRGNFVLPVQLLSFSMLFSIVTANLVWGQSIIDSLISTIPYTVIPIFFILHILKFPINILEKVILFFGYIYLILNIFQLLNPEIAYFGHALIDDSGGYTESRGVTRIIFPGAGVFWLACFISISKLISHRGNKFILLPLAISGLIVPVLQATRQLIAFVFILYFLHFGFQLSLAKKLIISISILVLGIYLGSLNLPVFNGIVKESRETKNEGTKYIRFIAAEYYLTEFSENIYTKIFGNGIPNSKSVYGIVTSRLVNKGIFLEDIGIIGLYSQVGVLAVIAWLLIWYKSFTIKIPKEYYYCKYYLWMMLFTSLTSGSIYNISYAISTTLVLFIFNQAELDKKKQFKRVLKFLIQRKLQNKYEVRKILVDNSQVKSPI